MNETNGYLLDTNILSYWVNENARQHERVTEVISALPKDIPVFMSAISWGEMQFGARLNAKTRLPETDCHLFEKTFLTAPVTRHTDQHYGKIKARLFEKFSPKELRSKEKRLSMLVDPVSGEQLGVDENDVWIVAQAIERNLVLVSNDKLVRIKEAAKDVGLLNVENWAEI